MTKVSTALEQARKQLDPESRIDAEILLSHVLHKNRAYLYAHLEDPLSADELVQFQHLIQVRSKGTPIAYIIGYRDFWSLSLEVNEHTLIPRHETERLVELALDLLPQHSPIQLLDLGTGSGAIALALAKERPLWHIDACDISIEALKLAQKNATAHQIKNVTFYQSNWFQQLPEKKYHAIVTNPPYIAKDDPHLKQGDLRFEPVNALISEQAGLADIEYIIKNSCNWLLADGLLLLEHGFEQKLNVQSILNLMGFKRIHSWQDLLGHDRVTGGWHS